MAKPGGKPLLDRYVAYTASYFYHDKVLKTAGYSFSTLAALLRVLRGGKGNHITEGLDKLYGEVSMTRCLTRFVGTTDAIEALKNDSWASPDWRDDRIRKLVRFQAWMMVIYHPMEHVGWAAYVAPKLVPLNGDWWFAKACYSWVAYVVVDLYISLLKLKELARRDEKARRDADEATDEAGRAAAHTVLDANAATRRAVKLQVWRAVFYLPNAIHWCFIKPPMPKGVVAVLGLAEALVGLRQTFPGR